MAEKQSTKKPKGTVKDSVFVDLFRNKKYLLQLYQALHPEDTEADAKDLEIVTIANVLTDGLYNDLGFIFKEKLIILVESQSKWTVNILIRALMYLMQTYYDYLIKTGQDFHGTKKVTLPKPELYVIYIGDRKLRPEYISFAEEYFKGQECCLDAKIKVIYDGQEGDIINQYVIFTKVFNEQVKKYGRVNKAILETIRICKDRNVLREYLENRESEVMSIMMALYDGEAILELYVRSQRREAAEAAAAEAAATAAETAAIKTTIEESKYFKASKQDTAARVMEKFHLPEAKTAELLEKYW